MYIPPELFQHVADYLDASDALPVAATCHAYYDYIRIRHICHSCPHLTQRTLELDRYAELITLNISHNIKIHNIAHLSGTLTRLIARGYSMLSGSGLTRLTALRYLDVTDNVSMNRINNANITHLIARNCQISQASIAHMNRLVYLDIEYNTKITNLDHVSDTLIKLVPNNLVNLRAK